MFVLCILAVVFAPEMFGVLEGMTFFREFSWLHVLWLIWMGDMALQLIVIHSIILAVIHPTAFCLANSFRAANDVSYTMIIAIASMWICRIGFSYVFVKYLGMGVMGVWLAMFCDWIVRAIIFGTRFIRGTWLTKYKAFETTK